MEAIPTLAGSSHKYLQEERVSYGDKQNKEFIMEFGTEASYTVHTGARTGMQLQSLKRINGSIQYGHMTESPTQLPST